MKTTTTYALHAADDSRRFLGEVSARSIAELGETARLRAPCYALPIGDESTGANGRRMAWRIWPSGAVGAWEEMAPVMLTETAESLLSAKLAEEAAEMRDADERRENEECGR